MFDVQFLINAQQMDRPVSWGGGWRRKGTYSSLMNQLKQENFIIFGAKILSEPNICVQTFIRATHVLENFKAKRACSNSTQN